MEITIKNVKYAAFASQETHCFQATLYVDGKRFCSVENDGHGGCDNYHTFASGQGYDEINMINIELGAIMHEVSWTNADGTRDKMGGSLEQTVCELVNDFLFKKDFKKAMKKVCWLQADGIYSLPAKHKPTAELLKRVQTFKWWEAGYQLLNLMPEAEAMKVYRANA